MKGEKRTEIEKKLCDGMRGKTDVEIQEGNGMGLTREIEEKTDKNVREYQGCKKGFFFIGGEKNIKNR